MVDLPSHLVQSADWTQTGDSYYRGFMRQDLWDGVPTARVPSFDKVDLTTHLPALLRSAYGTVPAAKKLHSSFKLLRTRASKALGREPVHVVVGVPTYISSKVRKDLRAELEAVGFQVLATIRQPALATEAYGFHATLEDERREYTALNIDYNHASPDIALVTTEHRATDVVAQEPHPELGEDALDMKIASLAFNNEVGRSDQAPLTALAGQVQLQRKRSSIAGKLDLAALDHSSLKKVKGADILKLDENDSVEERHASDIVALLERFVSEQTYETTGRQPWKPLLADLTSITVAGDGSSRSLEALRKALSGSSLARLHDLGTRVGAVPAIELAVKGAAMNGKARMVQDKRYGDEEPHFMVHHEL